MKIASSVSFINFEFQNKYGMKRILVTGGAGFIGSHLCERLLKEVENIYTTILMKQGMQN